MHQDDATAFLKAKLEDRNPKCGNCRHWEPRTSFHKVDENNKPFPCHPAISRCLHPANEMALMANLSQCSNWGSKE